MKSRASPNLSYNLIPVFLRIKRKVEMFEEKARREEEERKKEKARIEAELKAARWTDFFYSTFKRIIKRLLEPTILL